MLFYLFEFFTSKHRSLNFVIFLNLINVIFFLFSNNFNLFSQYFFQYNSWLHLKWSLNLTSFSKSLLVFLIYNYIANFIPFFFSIHPHFISDCIFLVLSFCCIFQFNPWHSYFNCLANITLFSLFFSSQTCPNCIFFCYFFLKYIWEGKKIELW